jgi:hypothetical protein
MPSQQRAGLWFLLCTFAASAAIAQLPASVGTEFQVNTFTQGSENVADIGVAANGDFVVVWHSDRDSAGEHEVMGQRFG